MGLGNFIRRGPLVVIMLLTKQVEPSGQEILEPLILESRTLQPGKDHGSLAPYFSLDFH